jgi:hypothetical protein
MTIPFSFSQNRRMPFSHKMTIDSHPSDRRHLINVLLLQVAQINRYITLLLTVLMAFETLSLYFGFTSGLTYEKASEPISFCTNRRCSLLQKRVRHRDNVEQTKKCN